MEKPNRKSASLGLLSIIVPVTLLVTFRLTGLQPQPQTPQTTTVETAYWNITRPELVDIIAIDERVKNTFIDDIASINLTVHVAGYWENYPGYWLFEGGYDEIDVRIVLTANVMEGFIHSLVVNLSKRDTLSGIIVMNDPDFVQLQNMQLDRIDDFSNAQRDALVVASGINQPQDTGLHIAALWRFFDPNNIDHLITTTAEVTYFNGSTWKRAVLPIQLGVLVN